MRAWLLVLAGVGTLACTPALNWRNVPLGETTVLLPCKPDRAQRPVQLSTQQLDMEIVGCETLGGLFAASRMEVPAGMEPQALLAQWYAATLISLGDRQTRLAPAVAAAGVGIGRPLAVSGLGKRPDGSDLQARFLWQVGTREIVLLAVYAPRIADEMTEPFLVDLKLP